MAKDVHIGLVAADEQVDWAVLQRGRDGLERVAAGREDLAEVSASLPTVPADAVAASPLATRLKSLASRLKGRISLGLSSDHVMLRVLRLPAVDPEEIAGMVAFQAEKLSPFPIDTMVVSHEVLRRDQDASLVLLAAVRTEVVERQGEVLKAAGLAAARVDAAVLGWWRVLQDSGQLGDSGYQVELLLTAPAPQLFVVKDGLPLVFRTLSGVSTASEDVSELAREIGFTLVSLELEHGHLAAPMVTIWSETARGEAWRETLAQACGVPLQVKQQAELPSASEGLARRGAEAGRLDLTPPSWLQARATQGFRRRLINSAAAIVGAWLIVVGAGLGGLYVEKQRLAQIRAERERVQTPARAVRDTRRRVFMVRQYLDNTSSALECLRVLSEQLPPGIALTAFSYNKGEEVKISGEAPTVAVVYAFKGNLDATPLFQSATLQGPRQIPNGRQAFDVSLQLRQGEAL